MSPLSRSEEIAQSVHAIIRSLIERKGELDTLVAGLARHHIEAVVAKQHLEEKINRLIADGWHGERRRLFLAGAEWARRQFEGVEPPAGFYHAMESEAENVARR